MKPVSNKPAPQQPAATEQENTTAAAHTPRKLTFAENAILTVKVLVGAALLMGALWGINAWISPD